MQKNTKKKIHSTYLHFPVYILSLQAQSDICLRHFIDDCYTMPTSYWNAKILVDENIPGIFFYSSHNSVLEYFYSEGIFFFAHTSVLEYFYYLRNIFYSPHKSVLEYFYFEGIFLLCSFLFSTQLRTRISTSGTTNYDDSFFYF